MAAELPSDSIYDILSRLPVKSLARFRCVSKLWCNYINDPYLETMHAKREVINYPILLTFRQFPPDHPPNSPCTLSFIKYKEEEEEEEEEEASSCTLEMRKKPPAMEFMFKIKHYRQPESRILGSCNGLLYLSSLDDTFIVIHPLMRECYELPPLITPQLCRKLAYPYIRMILERLSGLGFDDSTNTFKMVCVIMPTEKFQCTMVHVLGTDSWRQIPQVPSTPIDGGGVFVNGCLHWLPRHDYDWPIITFDIKTEEFGLIKPPQEIPCGRWIDVHLVDLHGQLGFVYTFLKDSSYRVCVEVWVLKKRGWVMHCRFENKPPIFSYCDLKVLGCWNENGDILVVDKRNGGLYVYSLKDDSLYEVSLVGLEQEREKDIRMYQSSLFATRYSIRKNR